MSKPPNQARVRRKRNTTLTVLFIFLTFTALGFPPRIFAFMSLDQAPESDSSGFKCETHEESTGISGDYLDEVCLRQNIKSALAAQIKKKTPEDNPPVTAEAVFSAQVLGKVALSFDDGPYEGLTEEYIRVLKDHGVGATFFMVGDRVESFPEQAQKVAQAGFEIGIHSFAHSQLTKKNLQGVTQDFQLAVNAVKNAAGIDVRLFRPPYGEYNDTVLEVAANKGLQTIRWNVDPRDWEEDDPQAIVDNILTYSTNGSIILMHEGRYSTLKALPMVIEGLRDRGFEIVSVTELLAEEHKRQRQEGNIKKQV